MINYSIVKRSVNANLFEINQAKSRINQAKKENKEPEKSDLELVKTENQKAFAISQYTDVMTIEKFSKHISTHGCVYSRADISAILYMAVDCMREQLLEGKKIRLGALGDFFVNLSSKGADSAEKFTAQNITEVKVLWEPGAEFKNLLADAEFNLVPSRTQQAALLKAIKEGKEVDGDSTTSPDGDNNGGKPGGSTSGDTDGGGTASGGSDGGGSDNTDQSGTGGTENPDGSGSSDGPSQLD